MKNINILLKGATKLNKQEMKNVKGGMSYCDTLQTIARGEYAINEWTSAQWDACDHAWSTHCIN